MKNLKKHIEHLHLNCKPLFLFVALLFVLNIYGQKKDSTVLKTRPFHLSLITPLGTNGMESPQIINNVSINLIAGHSGGLNGAEFSGFASILNHDMKGARFSGFANITLGTSNGADFAGFVNFGKEKAKGAQFAGFTNIITRDVIGTQVSGFVNVTKDNMDGLQLAGFSNIIGGQGSLVQASGFVNSASGKVDGAQVAGFANYSNGGKLGQVAGFINVASDSIKGAQVAGFVNTGASHVKGFQLAGFINVANKLNGVQLAPFNYVDSLEHGVPIGVLSFVKNGYHAVSISANESHYFNLNLKTGTHAFYTYLTSGIGARNQKILWHWGFGAGTMMPINEKTNLSFELQASHVNEDEWYTPMLNIHNQLTAATTFALSEHIAIRGGISWNVIVSDITDDYGRPWETSTAPFSVFDKTYNNTNIKMYPGLSIGIEFN